MSVKLAAMGPGASGNGVRTVTAPRSALGPGVSLHAYDIVVLVVYFIFVIGVGVWVSRSGGWGMAGEAEACSHLQLVLESGARGADGRQVREAQGLRWKGLQGSPSPVLSFKDGQIEVQRGV